MRTVTPRTVPRSPSSCSRSACTTAAVPQASHTVPTGLPGTRAAGPGDAGDRPPRARHRRVLQRAGGHRARHLGSLTAPCAAIERARHAQQLGLGRVAVGDEAALEPVARAGHSRCRRRRSGRRCSSRRVARRQPRARKRIGQLRAPAVSHRARSPQVGSTSAIDQQRAAGGHQVVEQDAQALAPADGLARLQLEQAVGPAHRARAWRRRRSGTARRPPAAPARPAGITSQSTIQKAITSSQTIAPGSATRQLARGARAGPPAQRQRQRRAPRAQPAAPSQWPSTQERHPGPQRAHGARRAAAPGRCRSRARSSAPGGANMKAALGARRSRRS